MQEFQVCRQPIPSTRCGNRESPVTSRLTCCWYDQVIITVNLHSYCIFCRFIFFCIFKQVVGDELMLLIRLVLADWVVLK